MERHSWRALVNMAVWAVSSGYGGGYLLALLNVAVWAVSRGYGEGQLLALLNVAVWAVTSGYVEGQWVGTGECGGRSCNVRLFRGTFCGLW